MKKFYLIYFLAVLAFPFGGQAQTGFTDSFEDGLNSGWNGGSHYQLSVEDNQLRIDANNAGPNYESFIFNFPSSLDLRENPYVQFTAKSNLALALRVDLGDNEGHVTNRWPIIRTIPGTDEYVDYIFDFSNMFAQSYPGNEVVNAENITSILFMFNPNGEGYNETVFFDNLKVGSDITYDFGPERIRLNQLGFYPEHTKKAVVVSPSVNSEFKIIRVSDGEEMYTGTLSESIEWEHSGEIVSQADFSSFTNPGRYTVYVEGLGSSYEFEIRDQVHHDVLKGSIKSFYYQRASMPIEAPYAGDYARPAGHPDTEVKVHSTAADDHRPAGYVISSPGGWYDAGDYGKYIVNSGVSTFSILSTYESYKDYFDTLELDIPQMEGIPDILNEALYNVRWMLTMQDPNDGGVYHKLTSERHDGHYLPHLSDRERFVFKKSTSASLNFAAIMAQSYRIYAQFEDVLPGFADSCIAASVKAYNWSVNNPSVYFSNPTGVSTGPYDDNNITDEFSWASAELLVSTRDPQFADRILYNVSMPSWKNTSALALISLNKYRDELTGLINTTRVRNSLTNSTLNYSRNLSTSAYGVAMGASNYDFVWGSNAYAGNQGFLLLEGYLANNNNDYFEAALSNLDYLLGRNGVGYSFITNYGSRAPIDPHHRISATDGNLLPVPGLVVGGPQPGREDAQRCPPYPSSYRGAAYLDQYCSYSTNENAINYNSAFVALAGGIEAIQAGGGKERLILPEPRKVVLNNEKAYVSSSLKAYPNPADNLIKVMFNAGNSATDVQVMDLSGKVVLRKTVYGYGNIHTEINVSHLNSGVYILSVKNGNNIEHTRFVKY